MSVMGKTAFVILVLLFMLLIPASAHALLPNFDNSNEGNWSQYFSFPLTTLPTEHAVYKIEIDGEIWKIYNVYGELEASGYNPVFWKLVREDGADIRVFNQTGAQLYFWIEKWNYTSQRAVIWVNLTPNSTELNIAYGNPSASKSKYNNITKVFELYRYDPFETLDRSFWTHVHGTWVGVTSKTHISPSKSLKLYYEWGRPWHADVQASLPSERKIWLVEVWWKNPSTDTRDPDRGGASLREAIDGARVVGFTVYPNKIVYGAGGNSVTEYGSFSNVWLHFKIVYENGFCKVYREENGKWVLKVQGYTSRSVGAISLSMCGYVHSEYVDDLYLWTVKPIDTADFGTGTVKGVELNFTVTLISPRNGEFTTKPTFVFRVDGYPGRAIAKLYIDGKLKWSWLPLVGENTTVTIPDLTEGRHTWYVEVVAHNLTSSTTKRSEIYQFFFNIPPQVVVADYNKVVGKGQSLKIAVLWKDASGLTRGEFYIKKRGVWVLIHRETLSGTQTWFNLTVWVPENTTTFEFKQVVYDTFNNYTVYEGKVKVLDVFVIGKGQRSYYFVFVDSAGKPIDLSKLEYIRFISTRLGETYNVNKTVVLFLTDADDKIRIEFKYKDYDEVVTRDFETDLLDMIGVSHVPVEIPSPTALPLYEQVLYSSTNKPVIVKNVITQAYLAVARTKYTFQDAIMLPVYTVSGIYYLYTYDNGKLVLLGTLEGSKSLIINLDVLHSMKITFTISILGEELSISKQFNNTIKIYYCSQKKDNEQVSIRIYDLKSGKLLFNHTETVRPNELTLYFDYSTLNFTDDTLLKVEVTAIKVDGNKLTITRYFDLYGNSGIVCPQIIAFISLSLVVFGLTLVATRYALGLMGIVTVVIALGLTALAVQTWYIKLVQALLLIILIYIVLVYRREYAGVS